MGKDRQARLEIRKTGRTGKFEAEEEKIQKRTHKIPKCIS